MEPINILANQRHVGCLGGGQLGRMMAQAASRLGVIMTTLDPGGLDSPMGAVCGKAVTGSFTDPVKIRELAKLVDVVTVEIEHVDAVVLAELEAEGIAVHPSGKTIMLIQDKYAQKIHLSKLGGAVPLGDFCEIPDVAALLSAGERWGYPIMLKAKKNAYDGRGNLPVGSAVEAASAFATLSNNGKEELYAERWCLFTKELAVMVARSASGVTVSYPVVEMTAIDSQLHTVLVPASIDEAALALASKIASAAIASLSGGGIFGVELFLMPDGSALLNEIAPRPHNSGHYTMDSCHTDQFEMHLRCVLDLPLGSAEMKARARRRTLPRPVPVAAMLNVIGSADGSLPKTLASVQRALTMPSASIHWYGKSPPKAKRKMGHINVTATSSAGALAMLSTLQGLADQTQAAPLVGIIMGSDSDLPTMRAAAEILEHFKVPFELTIVSAHRTPKRMFEYAQAASGRGLQCIIAGAGGAAHLPGMVAALTPLPVIGVPVKSSALSGNDSLLSIVQMPRGVPVATVAIGNAANAGLLAVRMLGMADRKLRAAMATFMAEEEATVLAKAAKLEKEGYAAYAAPPSGM
ncbi:phosphoribosylaminoimidazole carboxylase [Chrysochromulina tobinii]|uniref:phosphoribosylaminoimidazole carboxylase n=1 Tax=Chrysochromulina tobinii TaxID=1460289 RepID=A0A0M0JFK3_9EUKA|nr:phosphoribosylaminoimidazole carboxylase [Chrysochromulina tobinii]|eukprot:KOO24993.1 phosphoribosylaminoimidazole carboxylase [Chrysochromulina sp. CCMP291]